GGAGPAGRARCGALGCALRRGAARPAPPGRGRGARDLGGPRRRGLRRRHGPRAADRLPRRRLPRPLRAARAQRPGRPRPRLERHPRVWRDALHEAWGSGDRTFYALALAEPFRSVGRPAICADWFRTEGDGGPALALGTTIAWTAIDTSTRAVGVLACRLGIVVDLDAQGGLSAGTVRLTLHGLDG